MSMTNLLEVKNLSVAFETERGLSTAVDDISFTIPRGACVGIVGESGCGKSVTAMSLVRLLPQPTGRITGGEILFDGDDVVKMPQSRLRELRGGRVGVIFQEPMSALNPVHTIGDQIAETLMLHRDMTAEAAWVEAINLLNRVKLPSAAVCAHQYPGALSGGMRQRVVIAMALACCPELIIADEPTTALDVTIQLQIMQLLKRLRDETGMAILLITHDIGLVAEMADRVVVMYAGQCVEKAGTQQLFTAPSHPYTQALLRAVPGIHDARDKRLFSIPGTVPENDQELSGCRFAPRCPYGEICCRNAQPVALEPGHEVNCCAVLTRRGEHAG